MATALRLLRARRMLVATFKDGETVSVPYELLRVSSPSAEVQGHGGAEGRRLVRGKRDCQVVEARAAGHFAVQLTFDDGHDSGLFSWDLLRELGRNKDELMGAYEARLASAGFARDGSPVGE